MADAESTQTKDGKETGSWLLTAVVSIAILAAAGGLAALTFVTEPTAEKSGAAKQTAMLVEVDDADEGDYRPTISAQGTVRAARDIVVRPRVDGRIVSIDDSFTPGGRVEEDDVLVRLEPADYRNTLVQRKSELQQAKSELAIQKGRSDAARAEYDRFGEKLDEEDEELVLREPQLEAAKQKVEAAKAAVNQARLNVSRTRIRAPFDGQIVRRDVNIGSEVSASESLARLVGTGRYWVAIDLPLRKLRWVTFSTGDDEGARVRIRNDQAWPPDTYREGMLYKKVGILDDETRMARVLASVPDPLAREASTGEGKPSLVIGEFVEVTIRGRRLEGVVRLNRDYVRDGETVWVMDEGKLQIRDVDIRVRDRTHAYIGEGLSGGDKVVTTDLSRVEEGASLRLDGNDGAGSGE